MTPAWYTTRDWGDCQTMLATGWPTGSRHASARASLPARDAVPYTLGSAWPLEVQEYAMTTSRFPSGDAIRSVTAALGLAPLPSGSQSWALEASVPERAEELVTALEAGTWDAEEVVALAALTLSSVDYRLQDERPLPPDAEARLVHALRDRRADLEELLEHWACLDAEDEDEEFAATPLVRRALDL